MSARLSPPVVRQRDALFAAADGWYSADVFRIRIDPPSHLIEVDVAGEIDSSEVVAIGASLRSAAAAVPGYVRVLADLRAFRTRPASFGELAGTLQEVGRAAGVERVAEVVADGRLAEALDARTTSAGAVLRRFASPDAARAWLQSP